MNSRAYSLLLFVQRLALRIFFRTWEVVGAEQVPLAGPLIVIANHPNGLIDPILVMSAYPRPLAMLAKSTLYEIPVLGFVIRQIGTIPVYRARDGADTTQNAASLEVARTRLAAGAAIALFPEGGSMFAPDLAPFKTGAARLALETEAACGFAAGIQIQATGLYFENRRQFRSRALATIGPPRRVDAFAAAYERDPVAAVRELTALLETDLEAQTLSAPDWDRLALAERAGTLLALAAPYRQLAARVSGARSAIDGYRQLRAAADRPVADGPAPDDEQQARLHGLVERLRRYDRWLTRLGLHDRDLVAGAETRRLPRTGVRLLRYLALLPFGLAGAAVYYLPYRSSGAIARLTKARAELYGTAKLMVGVVAMPLWSATLVALAAWIWSWPGGLAAALALPLLAQQALRLLDTYEALRADLRWLVISQRRASLFQELAREQQEITAEMRSLGRRLGWEEAPP